MYECMYVCMYVLLISLISSGLLSSGRAVSADVSHESFHEVMSLFMSVMLKNRDDQHNKLHGGDPDPYACDECSFSFPNSNDFEENIFVQEDPNTIKPSGGTKRKSERTSRKKGTNAIVEEQIKMEDAEEEVVEDDGV